ncbi:MAG: YraN family protein [Magnetococcales bacterium]|nr:YraN family protein [Magnetococcales bacterium]
MTFPRRWLGRQGELQAQRFLRSRGCRLLDRNYSTPMGEIDIVARDGSVVVFCEVRTRSQTTTDADAIAIAGESVGVVKQNRLRRLAESYLQSHPKLGQCDCRFDVILVGWRSGQWRIEWIRDAFRPGW